MCSFNLIILLDLFSESNADINYLFSFTIRTFIIMGHTLLSSLDS